MDGCLICGVRHIGSCRPDHPAHRPLSAEEWAERENASKAAQAEWAERAAQGEVMGADLASGGPKRPAEQEDDGRWNDPYARPSHGPESDRQQAAARGEEHAGPAALAFVTEHRERVEAAVAAIKDPDRRAEAERHLRTIREEAAAREQTPSRGQEVELER